MNAFAPLRVVAASWRQFLVVAASRRQQVQGGGEGQRKRPDVEHLRALNEKRELESTNRALQRRIEECDLLRKEADHRLKNSLQIVSNMIHLQVPMVHDPAAAEALRGTERRVMAVAAVHERMYRDDAIGTISFDMLLHGLCEEIARAYGGARDISVAASQIVVARPQAIALALIINEVLTNAFKHGRPPFRVKLREGGSKGFHLIVSDSGEGPSSVDNKVGLGSRIVAALVQQIGGAMRTKVDSDGYHCDLLVPYPNE
jgi:two-component sensor histidine kinase